MIILCRGVSEEMLLICVIYSMVINHAWTAHVFQTYPFYKYKLNIIPLWISNHMPSKVLDEITFYFPKLQRCMGMGKYLIQEFIMDVITYQCFV